ncbi:TM2 domain-containing protein [Consotaella salsifontis]|uniref:TM2 domain-containing membrane protein YozV n=1 Tax=Consotaella salsifontis TaxID=1365950 RepID=A0A1T4LJJ4_9HYPH|nr:TM2 domain-containing protein [Consotaella salsifontis]SJZ54909.1 TM2 domain-containing membrane protein YozV [Consotaella salsifontis]
MRGKVLGYDMNSGEGMVSGDDGKRYALHRSSLGPGTKVLRAGEDVDFEAVGDVAHSLFVIPSVTGVVLSNGDVGGKNKILAGLLALFFGSLGVHKFYLGRIGAGLIMLLVFVFGWLLLGVPSIFIGIIAFVEAILYLTRSDEAFYNLYVVGKKAWF